MAERDAFGNQGGGGASPVPGGEPSGIPGLTPTPSAGAPVPASSASGLPTGPALRAPDTAPSGLPPMVPTGFSTSSPTSGGRRSNPLAMLISLVVAAAIIGVPVLLAVHSSSKTDTGRSTVFTPAQTAGTPAPTAGAPATPKPSTPPVGLGAGSLLKPAALARAIAMFKGNGRLTYLRVAPENIQAGFITKLGTSRHFILSYGQSTPVVTKSSGPGVHQPSIPLARIDVHAPTTILAHTHRHSKGIDYMLLDADPISGALAWDAYYKNTSAYHFAADEHGHHVTKH